VGEVRQKVLLENYIDKALAEEGQLEKDKVRAVSLDAVVDTGATLLALPQEVVEKLGLRKSHKVIVTYAEERKEERDVAGVVTLTIGERRTNTNCVVGPPNSEALIGQVILEEMDLIVDPKEEKLSPRPESPFLPLLKLK